MLQKLFKALYEAFLGPATPSLFIPTYRQAIFPSVGLFTLFVSGLLLAVVFYLILNRALVTSLYRTKHWLMMMVLAALTAGVFAYTQARSVVAIFIRVQGLSLTDLDQSTYNRYGWSFVFASALLGAVFFALWSFVVKWASVGARTTPVRWPN